MKISARVEYACNALLELSLHWPNEEPLSIQEISKRQGIPLRYLVQIMLDLKKVGIVQSMRGKEGGYILQKAPFKLTLLDVIEAMQGNLLYFTSDIKSEFSVFKDMWTEISAVLDDELSKITFEEIATKHKIRKNTLMYYI